MHVQPVTVLACSISITKTGGNNKETGCLIQLAVIVPGK